MTIADTHLPDRWVSIDPGDMYVGLATWQGRDCLKAIETTPRGLVQALEIGCHTGIIETVVCEKWELYPWLQKSMGGNEFLTCQLIGVIKYLTDKFNVPYIGQLASQGKGTYRTTWYKGLSLTDRKAMPWWGQLKNGDHAKDAWAHGRYFIKQRTGVW